LQADRVFLNDCGVFLHMLSWRDGYYWKAKERRASGKPEREFTQQLERDWEEFEQRFGKKRQMAEPRSVYKKFVSPPSCQR
jgi:hypothetical protein